MVIVSDNVNIPTTIQPPPEDKDKCEKTDHTDPAIIKASQKEEPDAEAKRLFADGKYVEAKKSWLTTLSSCAYALSHFVQEEGTGEKDKVYDTAKYGEFVAMKKKALLNLSLVSLKLREFGDTVNYSEQVLEIDRQNEKAIYRRSLGLYEQGKVLEAKSKLLENYQSKMERLPVAMKDLLNRIEQSILRKKQVERAMYEALKAETTAADSGKHDLRRSRFFRWNLFWNVSYTLMRGMMMTFKTHIDYVVHPVLALLKRT